MSSDKQNNFLKHKKNIQNDKESKEFLLHKEQQLSELPGKNLEKKSYAVEAEDSNDDSEDDEGKKIYFAEANTPMHSPCETFESEIEDDEGKGYQKRMWKIYENETTFDNICGLDEIKDTLLNIVIYPSIYPQFFPKRIRWNQILMYGPPGTGKTMLARALASEINATLHRITSADLLSHWQGQTEKQIRELFQDIRSNCESAILFFDEIDGLFRKRSSSEDESTRRIKTELLIHLDDFTAQFANQTFLIGATNCPWEIDSSFMRRFHKKIFVPLPNKEARLEIIKQSFESVETDLTDLQWDEIGERTEGYSGSDLMNVVMTSCCVRFMQTKKSKYWEPRGEFWVPAGSSSLFSTRVDFEDIHPDKVTDKFLVKTFGRRGAHFFCFRNNSIKAVRTPKHCATKAALINC